VSVAKAVIQNLITSEEYGRKVFPFLNSEYFRERTDRILFEIISGYVKQYSSFPSLQSVAIELTEVKDIDDIEFEEAKEFLCEVEADPKLNLEWLVDKTEEFCKQRAIELAISRAAEILRNESTSKMHRDGIPQMLQEALAVSFHTDLGHDYLEDWECRYDHYHDHTLRIPFHIEFMNKITGGGVPPKTLSVILAGTGVGKSMLMCDMAAHHLMAGKNVLYITLELSREMVGERIDANLMDTDLDVLNTLDRDLFVRKINKMKEKTTGKLMIAEFATTGAGAAHFRYLLNELKIKKGFVPDIIYIDYINICISTRYKGGPGSNANSYTVVKMIAEELRGLAVDYNVPVITATQTNRGGFTSTDLGLEDTAESFGLPATADFMISISQDDEMKLLKQVRFKQLKNRFRDVERDKKFDLGVEKSKMRFFELDASAQRNLNREKEAPKKKGAYSPAPKPKRKFANLK
jgi:replicative DNA helicase